MSGGDPASTGPISTRTRRRGAGSAGRAGAGKVKSTSTTHMTAGVVEVADHVESTVKPTGRSGPAGRMTPTQRAHIASSRRSGGGNTSKSRASIASPTEAGNPATAGMAASNAMDVDVVADRLVQDKSKHQKRKRSRSSASAAPNVEERTHAALQPSKKAKKSGSAVQPAVAQLPPKILRKAALPPIDVDKSESSPSALTPMLVELQTPQTEIESLPAREQPQQEVREDTGEYVGSSDEDSDSSVDDDDDGLVPEVREEGDLRNLAAEAVAFTRIPFNAARSREDPVNATSTRSTTTVDAASEMPPARRPKTRREQKLAEEMPVISVGKQLGQRSSKSLETDSADSDSDSDFGPEDNDIPWMAHTDISMALKHETKNRWVLALKRCGPEVKRVVKASFRNGMKLLALGDGAVLPDVKAAESMLTPFGARGMDYMAMNALISAAESFGYGGDYDIADRLKHGEEQRYIALIRNYTAHRLRTYRTDIKKAAASAYPSAIRLSSLPRDTVRKLLEGSNFLYPTQANGSFIYSQPFFGAGLAEVVRSAFFGDAHPYTLGTQNIASFTSSIPALQHELEIPAAMLAMAAAAVHSVLIDHVNPPTTKSGMTEFAGPILDNAFKAYMAILVNMRLTASTTYHALMHGICMTATGGNAVNNHGNPALNNILANVDWANMAGA